MKIYVHVYKYIYVHIHIHVHVHLHIHLNIHIPIQIQRQIHTYIHTYIHTNIPPLKPNTPRQNVGSVVHIHAEHLNLDNLHFALTHVPAAMHPGVEVAIFLPCQYHSLFYDARKLS